MDNNQRPEATKQQFISGNWILLGFLAITAFFLWTEHRAHLLGVLPFLFFLACPLMHLFHYGHHGRRGQHNGKITLRTDKSTLLELPKDTS